MICDRSESQIRRTPRQRNDLRVPSVQYRKKSRPNYVVSYLELVQVLQQIRARTVLVPQLEGSG